jgi:hypothetical protein
VPGGEALAALPQGERLAVRTRAQTPARLAHRGPRVSARSRPARAQILAQLALRAALVPEADAAARLARAQVRWRAATEEAGLGGAGCPAPSAIGPESGAAARQEPGALVRFSRSPERRSPEFRWMGIRSPVFGSMQRCPRGMRSTGRRTEGSHPGVWPTWDPARPEHRAAGQDRRGPMRPRARKDCPAAGDPAARARYPPAPSQSLVAGHSGTACPDPPGHLTNQ